MDVLIDILLDTLKMLPLIIITYIILDIYERNTNINEKINYLLSKNFGPIFGALIGCIPQCGFSFMAATLFCHKLITPGTLVAVFIATSDEAIPLLIANPSAYKALLILIITKIIIGVIAGYLLDFMISKFTKKPLVLEINDNEEEEEITISDPTCVCSNTMSYNVFKRTTKTALFILSINALLSITIAIIGEETLVLVLQNTKLFQPIIAALIGFIPNCAASIVLTQLYLLNGLSFGALIAGLCTGAGIGIIVLFKELHDPKKLIGILTYIFIVSVIVGEILQIII